MIVIDRLISLLLAVIRLAHVGGGLMAGAVVRDMRFDACDYVKSRCCTGESPVNHRRSAPRGTPSRALHCEGIVGTIRSKFRAARNCGQGTCYLWGYAYCVGKEFRAARNHAEDTCLV